MARKTAHYGLVKPGYGDEADIKVINRNFDRIDEALHGLRDSIGSAAGEVGDDTAPIPFDAIDLLFGASGPPEPPGTGEETSRIGEDKIDALF